MAKVLRCYGIFFIVWVRMVCDIFWCLARCSFFISKEWSVPFQLFAYNPVSLTTCANITQRLVNEMERYTQIRHRKPSRRNTTAKGKSSWMGGKVYAKRQLVSPSLTDDVREVPDLLKYGLGLRSGPLLFLIRIRSYVQFLCSSFFVNFLSFYLTFLPPVCMRRSI